MKADYNLHDFYRYFDNSVDAKNDKKLFKYLSFGLRELELGYQILGVYIDAEGLRLVFRAIDQNLDGRISKDEFFNFFCPTDD